MLTRDCKQLSCVVRFFLDCVAVLQLAHYIMVRKYNVKTRWAKRKSCLISVVRTARILPYACLLGILSFIQPLPKRPHFSPSVKMSGCCLQGIQPCECKRKGYQLVGNQVFRLGSRKE